jgi:hypothetical protein
VYLERLEIRTRKEVSMSHISDAHHFRKLVAGTCMVLSPLLMLVAMVVHPGLEREAAAQYAAIADNLDAWYLTQLLMLISTLLAFPAVLGLMHMLREREVAFGHLGGGLGLIGLVAFTGVVAIGGFAAWAMAKTGDRGAAVALLDRLDGSTALAIPFFYGSFAFTLGALLLAFGLYRARAAQSWMAICLAAGALVFAVGGGAATGWLTIVGAAVLFVGLGSVGRMVLTESDEDWEHTPEYRGFRPLAGTR